jgi:hypothetical protein
MYINKNFTIFLLKNFKLLNDFRNFCISNETEKVYQNLEEVIRIC